MHNRQVLYVFVLKEYFIQNHVIAEWVNFIQNYVVANWLGFNLTF